MFDSGAEFVPDRHINTVDEEYIRMAISESLEAAVLGIGIVLFLVMYMRLCLKHTREFVSVPDKNRIPGGRALKVRGTLMIIGASVSVVYYTAYRFILPYFEAAPMVGIALNILAVGVFAAFALEANQTVYNNNYEI